MGSEALSLTKAKLIARNPLESGDLKGVAQFGIAEPKNTDSSSSLRKEPLYPAELSGPDGNRRANCRSH